MRQAIVMVSAVLLALGFQARPAVAQAGRDDGPRVVLQNIGTNGIEVAAWSPDDRYLVVGSAMDRTISIVDLVTGTILDRAIIPSSLFPEGMEILRLEGLDFSPDGNRLLIHAVAGNSMKDGPGLSREMAMDMRTRKITRQPSVTLGPEVLGLRDYIERMSALVAIYFETSPEKLAAAVKKLPQLPRSKSGISLTRTPRGIDLRSGDGMLRSIAFPEARNFGDAALAEDGRRLVLVDIDPPFDDRETTTVRRFDLSTGVFAPTLEFKGDYGYVKWIDEATFLLLGNADDNDRDEVTNVIEDGLVINAADGREISRIPGRCFITALPNGDFLGAGTGNCSTGGEPDPSIQRFDSRSRQWIRVPLKDFKGYFVNGISVSPDGRIAAIVGVGPDDTGYRLLWAETTSGKLINYYDLPKENGAILASPTFSANGQTVYIPQSGGVAVLNIDGSGEPFFLSAASTVPQMTVVGNGQVFLSGIADDAIVRADLTTKKVLPPLDLSAAIAGGFLKDRPVFWAVSNHSGLKMWDTRDWHPLLSAHILPNGQQGSGFLVTTPDGRYDTNLGPDSAPFRWVVSDDPMTSLGPQTFMRDYYTPRLAQKLFDCTGAGTCAKVLPPLPSVTSLNRLLPKVKIVGVSKHKTSAAVLVDVEVDETKNARLSSGVYDVRLFVNGKMIQEQPDPMQILFNVGRLGDVEALTRQLSERGPEWQRRYNVPTYDGKARLQFAFPVPSHPSASGSWALDFSAYAYNADRVKSETDVFRFDRAPVVPEQQRPRRAYVVAIGVSAYDNPRLSLNFAANDAHLIADRLKALPGYEVRTIKLTGEKRANGSVSRITANDILRVLRILAHGKFNDTDDQYLRDLGVDPAVVDIVTPDDAVIISFSGHGWADTDGEFFLLASDVEWPDDSETPRRYRFDMLSSSMLATTVKAFNAGEVAIIIDACHSAASVATATFKPGPMGDAGLGQLAYDKGIRILAATQSDSVALETSKLSAGLLTYALAKEGLDPNTPAADLDRNGKITLDEWLKYAAQRLPRLSEEVAASSAANSGGDDDGLVFIKRAKFKPKPQEPALFDFTTGASTLLLKSAGR